jgi:sensor histidine kinase regulating citrate/malate metabolism
MVVGLEECRDLVSLLRTERHDFLNHLQVITGYLQLNRYQKAEEYAREAITQISADSSLFFLQSPALALCCFLNRNKALGMSVHTSFDCKSHCFPVECLLPEELVSMAWDLVLSGFTVEKNENKSLRANLLVSQHSDRLSFQVNWQGDTFEFIRGSFDNLVACCNEKQVNCLAYSIESGWEILLEKRKSN